MYDRTLLLLSLIPCITLTVEKILVTLSVLNPLSFNIGRCRLGSKAIKYLFIFVGGRFMPGATAKIFEQARTTLWDIHLISACGCGRFFILEV